MNKQDKKEIMNLIKYKKMLGGRRMELSEAIELLKTVRGNEYVATSDYENALNTVLTALDERYNKGYQDGYNQGYLAGAMERI